MYFSKRQNCLSQNRFLSNVSGHLFYQTWHVIELGSCLSYHWKDHKIVFHVVPLSQNVIFLLIPDFDGLGHN